MLSHLNDILCDRVTILNILGFGCLSSKSVDLMSLLCVYVKAKRIKSSLERSLNHRSLRVFFCWIFLPMFVYAKLYPSILFIT